IGLILVVVLLGAILAAFGGKVRVAEFHKNAAGENERMVVEKNKFLNARNLTQLAKDTSFVAIMAVGATFVIIAGGIDLSVGATYALASVLSAVVFSKGENQVWRGVLVCLGAATLCGLLNGGMIVLLKVHPFIITLGTMAIYRGIAFVVTQGQSVGGFPEPFRQFVRHETTDGLSLVPLVTMILVAV